VRRTDALAFFRTGNVAIPRRYRAGWVVVDHARWPGFRLPPRVAYRDGRYALYRL
jgi:hypothetical protein